MSEEDKGKRRDWPPYLNLEDSLKIIKEIHGKTGGMVDADGLAKILESTPVSSTFFRKVAALRAWGLISKEGNRFKLTTTGEAIAQPRAEFEYKQAILDSFLNVDRLKRIANFYAGKALPEGEFLISALIRDLATDKGLAEQWADTFKESGKTAGIFSDVKGRLTVRQNFSQASIESIYRQEQPVPINTPEVFPQKTEQPVAPFTESPQQGADIWRMAVGPFFFSGPQKPTKEQALILKTFKNFFEDYYKSVFDEQQDK